MGKILAVCSGPDKGEKKKPVEEARLIDGYGIEGDAHANSESHRQVSLLDVTSADKIRKLGADVGPGDFAENLTTEGFDLVSLPIGSRLESQGGVVLEVTQIGKECHSGCSIFKQVGTCVMPLEGIFTKVIKGGVIRPGDDLKPV